MAGTIPSIILANKLSNIFYNINLYNPLILMGILIGFVLPIIFTAMILKAVQKGSMLMVREVRRQFREIPGLREGEVEPDYDSCINISAKKALRNMLQPVLIIISITIFVGILFGPMVMAIGDNSLKINISNAIYPRWWTFKATSPNYLNITNTKMLKNGQWTQSSFKSGESMKIKTNITYNNENPPDLNYTLVNLLIYDPQGRLWYNNSIAPELNGEVIFSLTQFTSKNTIGGVYTYMLLWSNATALGGIFKFYYFSRK